MFPLRDNIPARTTPVVNYAVMAGCAAAFLAQSVADDMLVDRFAMIPARVTNPDAEVRLVDEARVVRGRDGRMRQEVTYRDAAPSAVPPWLTTLTCVFLHGGLMHIAGNLWFLWIFGDNVEDRLGHVGFAAFYLLAGLVASVTHLVTDPASQVPTVGASGAIAGVMGAYMVLYPKARVLTAVPIIVILQIVWLPAVIVLGVWFAIQLFSGVQSLGGEAAGVAWWAHIGGFAFGLAGGGAVRAGLFGSPPVTTYRSGSDAFLVARRGGRDRFRP